MFYQSPFKFHDENDSPTKALAVPSQATSGLDGLINTVLYILGDFVGKAP